VHAGASAAAALPSAGDGQLELPLVAEAFRGVGVETLPFGVSELTAKQRGFVLAYLRTGNAKAASRLAGLNETHASKMLKRASVLRLLNTVAQQVAANGDQLVRRKWELSVSLHHELMELRAKTPEERTGCEERREAQLVKMINQTDTLLAALLNRLGVKLSGELTTTQNINVTQVGAVVATEFLGGYTATRQSVTAANDARGSLAARPSDVDEQREGRAA